MTEPSGCGTIDAPKLPPLPQVIGLLVSHGAPVNSATLSGWTPLHGAASYGRALAAQQLLEMGAELHCR